MHFTEQNKIVQTLEQIVKKDLRGLHECEEGILLGTQKYAHCISHYNESTYIQLSNVYIDIIAHCHLSKCIIWIIKIYLNYIKTIYVVDRILINQD